MTAAILYSEKKGCEKKDRFSPREKTRQETIKTRVKMILDKTIHLICVEKSEDV